MAFSILVSTEGANATVAALYRQFLRREPDAGGMATFSAQFRANVRIEDIIVALAGSAEFASLPL